MNRDTLLNKICPGYRVLSCSKGNTSFNCNDCNCVLNEWLDEYDKKIRTDVINEFVHKAEELKEGVKQ